MFNFHVRPGCTSTSCCFPHVLPFNKNMALWMSMFCFFYHGLSTTLPSGQIIATSHDLGPQNLAKEGKSPYFREI